MDRMRAWEFNLEKFNLRVQSSILKSSISSTSLKFNLDMKSSISEKFNFKLKVQFTEVQFRVQN